MVSKWISRLALAAVLVIASPMALAQQMYVDVTNNTGFPIWHLYVSPASASDWEEDLLGASEVLENGRTKRITLTGYKSPRFDVRAVDSDGDSYTRMNVKVRESDVIFRLSDIDI